MSWRRLSVSQLIERLWRMFCIQPWSYGDQYDGVFRNLEVVWDSRKFFLEGCNKLVTALPSHKLEYAGA